MIIPDNKKILVLRYGTNILKDCMEKHLEVLEKHGCCWFAKLGRSPSSKILKEVFGEGTGVVILYARGGCYVCEVSEYSDKKPVSNMPEYYQEYIFDEGLMPSMYFKIDKMEKIPSDDLNRLVVSSSRNYLIETLNRSMNSFFMAETTEYAKTVVPIEKKKKAKKELLPIDECVYRKDGKCTNRSFVNYQYNCMRPSNCLKQKR